MNWTQAMIDLNGVLEEASGNGVTREEALQEVDNVFPVLNDINILKLISQGEEDIKGGKSKLQGEVFADIKKNILKKKHKRKNETDRGY